MIAAEAVRYLLSRAAATRASFRPRYSTSSA